MAKAKTNEHTLKQGETLVVHFGNAVYSFKAEGDCPVLTASGPIKFDPANLNTPKTATAITAAQKAYAFGDMVQEGKYKGFMYVGVSEDKKSAGYGEAMYMEAKGTVCTWYEGEERARGLLSQGFERARQGTIAELLQINRDDVARQGSGRLSIFNRSAVSPADELWSSTPNFGVNARVLSLPKGRALINFRYYHALSQCLC